MNGKMYQMFVANMEKNIQTLNEDFWALVIRGERLIRTNHMRSGDMFVTRYGDAMLCEKELSNLFQELLRIESMNLANVAGMLSFDNIRSLYDDESEMFYSIMGYVHHYKRVFEDSEEHLKKFISEGFAMAEESYLKDSFPILTFDNKSVNQRCHITLYRRCYSVELTIYIL